MDAAPALRLLDFSHRSLGMNLQGVTHEESLIAPDGGGNCMNWVIGHLAAHRDKMLALVGEAPVLDPAVAARYDRGSAPVAGDGDDVRPLDALRAALEAGYPRLRAAIEARDEAAFAAPSGKGTLGEALIFLLGHEWYHGGQVGLLRRVSGHPGAIQ
jgi:hypothetical protein